MNSHSHRGQDFAQSRTPIAQVHEGMAVYDIDNERIGSVDEVHFGAANEAQQAHGTGPVTTTRADTPRDEPLADAIAAVFNPGEVPQELAEKLLLNGYIRIDSAGLFAADRYITPDQIESVSDEDMRLNVAREQLIKRR